MVIVVDDGEDVVEEAVVRNASEQLCVEGSCPKPTRHRGRPTVEKTGKLQPSDKAMNDSRRGGVPQVNRTSWAATRRKDGENDAEEAVVRDSSEQLKVEGACLRPAEISRRPTVHDGENDAQEALV